MIRLSNQQKRILSALSEIGAQPIPALARAAGLREHSARYALDNLLKRKIVSPLTYINVRRLGYGAYSIFFSLVGGSKEQHQKLMEHLYSSDRVSWVAEFAGDFQYAVTIFARRVDDFENFLDTLSSRAGIQLSEKAIRLEFSFDYYPLKYFLIPGRKCLPVRWASSPESTIEIDETDHKLLSELSVGDHPPLATLARKIGIPGATAHNRIEALKKNGVIETFTYSFDAHRAGLQTYKCLIFTRGIDPQFRKALLEFGKKHPYVSLIVTCAGAWDFEINFTLDDSAQLNDCILELYARFGAQISTIKSIQLIRHLKLEMYPFRRYSRR